MSNGAERVARHHDEQRKRGLKLVKVWVPEDDVRRLQEAAKKIRAEAGLPLPADNTPPFPGWAYLRVERGERELQKQLRQYGARWLKDAKAWRLRADLVDELGLRGRVCDWGPDARPDSGS